MTEKTKNFLKKIKSSGHWNDNYNYSKVEYVGAKTNVIIICPIHGEFLQTPNKHVINKRGCQICGGTKLITKDEFLKRAKLIHGDKYDYSKVIYKDFDTKLKIICPIHGEFLQKPIKHITAKHGCYKCGGTKLKTNPLKSPSQCKLLMLVKTVKSISKLSFCKTSSSSKYILLKVRILSGDRVWYVRFCPCCRKLYILVLIVK